MLTDDKKTNIFLIQREEEEEEEEEEDLHRKPFGKNVENPVEQILNKRFNIVFN